MKILSDRVFVAACLATVFSAAASGQSPTLGRIQNNYSYILPDMPNYGIAQGSIFIVTGINLANAATDLQSVPLSLQLNGTSVSVTVNGKTTQAILYYVTPNQIGAILPSATPVGTGQLSVTVNGKGSAPIPITVVQSAFGMVSLNGAGNGPTAAFDINSNYLGLTNAANPGDLITLWGSGLGPVAGDETVTQTPVNLTDIPIEVDIGGKPAVIQYAGRSVYPGVDQINVFVPAGVVGCHTSVLVRTGDMLSNFGTLPVATSGRVCAEPVAGLTAGQIQTLSSKPAVTRGVIEIDNGVAQQDGSAIDVFFARFTNAQYAVRQPGASVSFGDCTVFNFRNRNFGLGNPIQPVLVDAGPSIRYTTPSLGNGSLPNEDGNYSRSGLMPAGSFQGTYTFTGSGGADVGGFSAQIAWPGGGGGFSFATPNNPSKTVNRSNGLTVTWTQPSSTDPSEFIQISGFSFVPTNSYGAEFVCNVQLAAGRFTIPPAVLLALPAQPSGAPPQAVLEVDLIVRKAFTAPGADEGSITFVFGNPEPFSYQ